MSDVSPTTTFVADQLLDAERMEHGPMDVYWNQDGWIEHSHPQDIPPLDVWPSRSLKQRLRRVRRFCIAIRIAPPPDTDLEAWGREIAATLSTGWSGRPKNGDRAVWLFATAWARNAGNAIGSAGLVLERLEGKRLSQAQARVWESGGR